LGKKTQLRIEVVHKLALKQLTMTDAQVMLGCSERTLWRLLARRKSDPLFFQHRNTGRVAHNRKASELKSSIQALMRERYFDFNCQHAREKIEGELKLELKRETFRKWMHEIGLVKGARKKRRRPRFARDRMSQMGLLVLMDGSYHRWFGRNESCLIAAMDDATSEILWAEFCDSETTIDCLRVLKRVVEERGIFRALYVDQAGVFGCLKRAGFTQVERAMGELGTAVIYAQSPEAKGRIERLFRTLQDRLIPEMRLRGITGRREANAFLQDVFIPHQYRDKFTVIPHNPVSAFLPVHPTLDLGRILIRKETRVVAPDHTFSVGAETFLITEKLKHSIARYQIEIRWNEQGTGWSAYFAGRPLNVARFTRAKKIAA
jgi:hypothetical protein